MYSLPHYKDIGAEILFVYMNLEIVSACVMLSCLMHLYTFIHRNFMWCRWVRIKGTPEHLSITVKGSGGSLMLSGTFIRFVRLFFLSYNETFLS